MEEMSGSAVAGGGFKLLGVKLILGALAAIVGMILMRILGGAEFVVAILIGIVPGIAERSPKKAAAGAVLGLVGYFVGARAGVAVAKAAQGVPFGHWAITGGFIGLTSGISRREGLWRSPWPRATLLGAGCGFILGAIFGFLGDIAGLLAVFAFPIPSFLYMRTTELSLLCAGIFINLGAAAGSGLEARLDRKYDVGGGEAPAEV
jgi:hypothetical protein